MLYDKKIHHGCNHILVGFSPTYASSAYFR